MGNLFFLSPPFFSYKLTEKRLNPPASHQQAPLHAVDLSGVYSHGYGDSMGFVAFFLRCVFFAPMLIEYPFSQLHPAHCGPGKELKTIPPLTDSSLSSSSLTRLLKMMTERKLTPLVRILHVTLNSFDKSDRPAPSPF